MEKKAASRIMLTLLLLAGLIGVVRAQVGPANTPYPMYGLDTCHTNRSMYRGPVIDPKVECIFTDTATDAPEGPLSIGPDGTLYLSLRGSGMQGSRVLGLHAFNPDGTLKWTWNRQAPTISGTAAIVEGDYLYVNFATDWPLADFGLAKLSQGSGAEIWAVPTTDAAYMSSPAVDQSGNIYFGSYDCKLRSVAPDGSLNWAYTAGSRALFCSPAIADDGTIYAANGAMGAIALNPDGSVKWTAPLPDTSYGARFGPNILDNGIIVFRGLYDTISAFNKDGELQWSRDFDGVNSDATGAVAPDGTTLYVKTGAWDNRKLVALSNTGDTVWEFPLANWATNDAPIVGSDGTIYVSNGASVSAMNPGGTELWTLSLSLGGNYRTYWPVIGGDGKLYVIAYDQSAGPYPWLWVTKIVKISEGTIPAAVNVDPDILNLGSNGKWITAYIQLPEGYSAADIDASTIMLNGTIQPVLDPKYGFVTNSSEYLVDHNNDGILERMVKFDRASIATMQSWIYQSVGMRSDVALTITGELFDGTVFEGKATISVFWTGQRSPCKR